MYADDPFKVAEPALQFWTAAISPVNRMPSTKTFRNFLRCFTDDLQAPHKRTLQGCVYHKPVRAYVCTFTNQVICLRKNMAEVITRLERHSQLRQVCVVPGT